MFAVTITHDANTSSLHIDSYTRVLSPKVSLSRVYISACSPPDSSAVNLYNIHPTTTHDHSAAQNRRKKVLNDYASIFALQTKKKYKPVAKKIVPVTAELPAKFRINRKITGDPLADIPILDPNPPPFESTGRYTQERKDALDKANANDFLWPAERALLHDFMCKQNEGFAWNDL